MSYRPYPDQGRALRQIDRHSPSAPPRRPSMFDQRMSAQARLALTAMSEAMRPMLEDFARQTRKAGTSLAVQLAAGPGPRDFQRARDEAFGAGRFVGYREGSRRR